MSPYLPSMYLEIADLFDPALSFSDSRAASIICTPKKTDRRQIKKRKRREKTPWPRILWSTSGYGGSGGDLAASSEAMAKQLGGGGVGNFLARRRSVRIWIRTDR
jgi:hypothetical protein